MEYAFTLLHDSPKAPERHWHRMVTVDWLSGVRGLAVFNGMQTVSDTDGAPVRQMGATLDAVMRSSLPGTSSDVCFRSAECGTRI
jgi:hypothetical protein